MIKRYNRTCRLCRQEKLVQYYILPWQKQYEYPLGFPFCGECASRKEGLVLYREWIAVLSAMDGAVRNEAQWS